MRGIIFDICKGGLMTYLKRVESDGYAAFEARQWRERSRDPPRLNSPFDLLLRM